MSDVGNPPPGKLQPATAWVKLNRLCIGFGRLRSRLRKSGIARSAACECELNRLCIGFGRLRSRLRKSGIARSAACECGAEEKAVEDFVLKCSIHQLPKDCTTWRFLIMRQSLGCSTLPRDIVRPSSGLKEITQTIKKKHHFCANNFCNGFNPYVMQRDSSDHYPIGLNVIKREK